MNKIALTGLAVAMLILSGCSQKNPEIDMQQQQQQVSTADKKAADISGMDANNMDSGDVQSAVAKKIAGLEEKSSVIYFDFDKYNIRPDMQAKIDANAALFNTTEAKDFSIKVEGNCDEWGTDEYNYALGLKRAKSVKDSLVTLGVSAERVMLVSYGESNPVCSEKTKECWDKNRRADFKLLP